MAEAFCPHCMQDISDRETICPSCGREVELRAKEHQIPIGSVLHTDRGRSYLFGKAKGEGGFGITYIAREMSSQNVVAIKEYFPTRCQPQRMHNLAVQPTPSAEKLYESGRHSFLSEASMLRAVNGTASIVHVLDFFEANNTAYMVMEYLNGTTLSDLMRSQSRFEPAMLFQKLLPLMRDLAKLHDAGVLHRDIAPDNIMQMRDGSLKLLDFGCARSMEDGKSMTVMLKPGFAPIEQYQTRGQGPYTDIYAFCATVYYCLTGKVPPAAPERLMAVSDGGSDPLMPLMPMGINVTQEQEKVLLWGLAIQPSVRPQKMGEVIAHLESPVKDQQKEQSRELVPQEEAAGETETTDALGNMIQKHGLKLLVGAVVIIVILLLLLLLL